MAAKKGFSRGRNAKSIIVDFLFAFGNIAAMKLIRPWNGRRVIKER